MATPEQLIAFEQPLIEQCSPEDAARFYEVSAANASKHVGPDMLFRLAPTDLEVFPDQSIDCQYVPAMGLGLDPIMKIADAYAPGIGDDIDEFAEEHEATLKDMQRALQDGYNIIEAGTTHSYPHDIAFAPVKVTAALVHMFGPKADTPSKRAHIFAKSLAWYEKDGINAPTIASAHAGIFFVIPNSKSGSKYPRAVRQAYNERAVLQREAFLDQGGARLILAPGGSTNAKRHRAGKVIAECQPSIKEGSAELLMAERTLVLPEACYIDPSGRVHIRLGELATAQKIEDCVSMGQWGARAYHEMSGIITWQALTVEQAETFAKARLSEMVSAAKESKLGQFLARHASEGPIGESEPKE